MQKSNVTDNDLSTLAETFGCEIFENTFPEGLACLFGMVTLLQPEIVWALRAVPYTFVDGTLTVITDEPNSVHAGTTLRRLVPQAQTLKFAVASSVSVDILMKTHYHRGERTGGLLRSSYQARCARECVLK